MAGVKLKLCRAKRERRRGKKGKGKTAKLRDQEVKEQFHIEIRNRFEELVNNEDDSIEQDWLQLKTVYSDSAYAVLGGRRRIKSDCIRAETYRRMDERRPIKEQLRRDL